MKRALCVLIMAVSSWSAAAHDFYETYCCDERDCSPYEGEVREEPTGYRIVASGELVLYRDARVSPDGRFHRCVFSTGGTRCLYAPPRGY